MNNCAGTIIDGSHVMVGSSKGNMWF